MEMKRFRTGIYLPSVFTAINIGCGFMSVLFALQDKYSLAAWLIVIGWAMDSMDGYLARMTNTDSKFGMEFDSIADMASFGMAPALLVWIYYLKDFRLGWAVCLLFVLTVAIRLARYNTSASSEEKSPYFEGLPSPAAAGILAAFVLLMEIYKADSPKRSFRFLVERAPLFAHILPFIIILISFLMLTKLRYPHGSRFKLTGMLPMRVFIITIVWLVLFVMYPESVISLMLIAYLLYGLLDIVIRTIRMRKERD
ncbi:CDP-diacylglycerol--serine O-phosphatidyltransferase [bacterium]|nr:CDP-diacylglycerol--serine O-phosphatidyltransferase [Candidatus Omnitrophota bacterium]MBU2529152.1 CDP-diacylglycerol--serine O-phosphatidyltransferase [bacterium]MBU3930578.1 CDP-diacylglycerol--serine O-phosphatidyltransferase [bacterium]MBU4123062.1 CDP-diacylglycerol--serine O-phosphatidyltransferase [bacterium]